MCVRPGGERGHRSSRLLDLENVAQTDSTSLYYKPGIMVAGIAIAIWHYTIYDYSKQPMHCTQLAS